MAKEKKEPTEHMLTVTSILFIIFGIASGSFAVLATFAAAYNLYQVGFWAGFVTAIIAVFGTVYALSVVVAGILGIRRKKLDLCYKLGVILAVLSILKIIMSLAKIFMGLPLTPMFFIFSVLSVAAPILFVKGVSREQNRKKSGTVTEPSLP